MLNKTLLIGNVGAEVETRYTKTQVAVATFRVATSERWKDNDGKAHFTAEIIAREMKMLGGERADILAPPEDDHEPPPTFSLTRRGIAQFIMAASKRSYMTTCTHMTTCLCRLIGAENA